MVRIVQLQHAGRVGGEVIELQLPVRERQNGERIGHRRRPLVVLDHVARPVRRREPGFALHVPARHVDFMRGQDVLQIQHPLPRILAVAALGEPLDQLLECAERLQRSARIVLRVVLGDESVHEGASADETHEPLQVVGVVDVRVTRMELDEPVRGGQRLGRAVGLVVGVDEIELGLHRQRAERISDFELVVVTYRLLIRTAVQIALRRVVETLRGPVPGRVRLLAPHGAPGGRRGGDNEKDETRDPCHAGRLARISHQVTAADANMTTFAALNAARVLDVLASTPARP